MNRKTGDPTWIDVSTTDIPALKAFYEGLFGWTFTDSGPDMGHYHMIRQGDGLVGGAMDVTGMTDPSGATLPSAWSIYLAVEDVDARTKKAAEAGGHVCVEPMDAGAAGRFSMVVDPSGAMVGLWQVGDTSGYEFSGTAGTPVWFELMTQNMDAAAPFYRDVFDFDLQPMGGDPNGGYFTNGSQSEASSGMCDAEGFIPAEMGSFWRVYLAVDNADESLARLTELGGTVLDGPEDTPFGRIATVADPTGASFQLCSPSEAV